MQYIIDLPYSVIMIIMNGMGTGRKLHDKLSYPQWGRCLIGRPNIGILGKNILVVIPFEMRGEFKMCIVHVFGLGHSQQDA
jgi:hypothetical protein